MAEENFNYAGFWVRLFAGILDLAFLAPIFLLLVYLVGPSDYQMIKIDQPSFHYSEIAASSQNKFIDYIGWGLSIVYITYFLSRKGQATIGKKLLGIYVGNPDGSQLTVGRSCARAAASILTSMTLGLGFVMLVFTKEKTALHDLICKTRVFHGKKS
jgi:uncharacterized RDD family membrane protein YckC